MYTFGTLQAKLGQFVIFDISGHPCQVSNIITSWIFKIGRVENDGTVTMIN